MGEGLLKMTLGSFGLIISGILCYRYIKQGVQIKKNKVAMRNRRKHMYMKNEVNISKQEIKSFDYDTDYLEEIPYAIDESNEPFENKDTDYLNDTDYLDDFVG